MGSKRFDVVYAGIYFQFVMIMCFVSLAVSIFIVHLFTRANAVAPSPMPPTVSQ